MSKPKRPKVPPPPDPSGYIWYDDEGNLAGEMGFDKASNAYIYKPKQATPEELAQRKQLGDLRSQYYGYLEDTPAETIQRAEDYAKRYSESLHKDVDRRFEEAGRSVNEGMEARGMFGSRAYVDMLAELDRNKREADVGIANEAAMAKESLIQNDRAYWLNAINAIESGRGADHLRTLQDQEMGIRGAMAGTQPRMEAWRGNTEAALAKYNAQANMYGAQTGAVGNAVGLAAMYGMYKLS
jgi:hypothetical protein